MLSVTMYIDVIWDIEFLKYILLIYFLYINKIYMRKKRT